MNMSIKKYTDSVLGVKALQRNKWLGKRVTKREIYFKNKKKNKEKRKKKKDQRRKERNKQRKKDI